MLQTITSVTFLLLALAGVAAWVLSLRRLRPGKTGEGAGQASMLAQNVLVAVITVAAGVVYLIRWQSLGHWRPLDSHADGLLLIGCLLAATTLYIQTRPRLRGMSVFALPLLILMLTWGICAAMWSYHPFNLESLDPVWKSIHLVGVYLGTISAAIAAIAGGTFLYVNRKLKHKDHLAEAPRLVSLERLESIIVAGAALGFALLTVGVIAALIVIHEGDTRLGPGWWHTPKVLLAASAWVVYALIMNVRYASSFRGTRAAWLSIAAFALLLATYAFATPYSDEPATNTEPHAGTLDAPSDVHLLDKKEAD